MAQHVSIFNPVISTTSTEMFTLELPLELLEVIFSSLNRQDLQSVALVNRKWNQVIVSYVSRQTMFVVNQLRLCVEFLGSPTLMMTFDKLPQDTLITLNQCKKREHKITAWSDLFLESLTIALERQSSIHDIAYSFEPEGTVFIPPSLTTMKTLLNLVNRLKPTNLPMSYVINASELLKRIAAVYLDKEAGKAKDFVLLIPDTDTRNTFQINLVQHYLKNERYADAISIALSVDNRTRSSIMKGSINLKELTFGMILDALKTLEDPSELASTMLNQTSDPNINMVISQLITKNR